MPTEALANPSHSGGGQPPVDHTDGKKPTRRQSVEHKQALAAGRTESRAVRRYLEALNAARSAVTSCPEELAERIEKIDAHLSTAEPDIKIRLIVERLDLYAQLKASIDQPRLAELEDAFVAVAGAYSARKGISYAAWRQVGIDDAVLTRAGISRS